MGDPDFSDRGTRDFIFNGSCLCAALSDFKNEARRADSPFEKQVLTHRHYAHAHRKSEESVKIVENKHFQIGIEIAD